MTVSRKLFYLQAFTALMFGGLVLSVVLLTISTFFAGFNSGVYAVSQGPWIEEGLKYLAALFLIRFSYIHPAAIPFIGIGFGFLEGVARIQSLGMTSIMPFVAHIVFASTMAFFFYLGLKTKDRNVRTVCFVLAYIIPVYLHLLFNFHAVGILTIAF